MPWPRGKPRKNHITKTGEPHKRMGRKPRVLLDAEAMERTLIVIDFSTSPERPQKRILATRKKTDKSSGKPRKYATTLVHPNYSIEPCPNCDFPEADGGHCPECGWTAPVVRQPANSVHGKLFSKR